MKKSKNCGKDGGLSNLCHSYGFACQQRVLKTFHGTGYHCSEDGVVWPWNLLVNLYIWLTISSCYSSLPLTLGLIGRDGGSRTLSHSCWLACHERMLKTFPGPDYLCSEDGVVWLWNLLEHLYLWLTILSCYGSIPLTFGLIGRNGGFSNMCHSWSFARQQRVLKTFLGPGYPCAEDGVVWRSPWLINLYIWHPISSCYGSHLVTLVLTGRDGGLRTLCHSYRFVCQQRVPKLFPGYGYLRSWDRVIWLWPLQVNLFIWLTILSCYCSISLSVGLVGRDGGLSTLCQLRIYLSAEGSKNVS